MEAAANDANERADKMEEKQRIFQKKLNEKVRKNRVKSKCDLLSYIETNIVLLCITVHIQILNGVLQRKIVQLV